MKTKAKTKKSTKKTSKTKTTGKPSRVKLLDPKIKRLWVEALLSGKYKQGVGVLRVDSAGGLRFCCLGVLCDLYVKNVKKKARDCQSWSPTFPSVYTLGGKSMQVPDPIRIWAGVGVDVNSVLLKYKSKKRTLDALNDLDRASFKTIARLIEEQL